MTPRSHQRTIALLVQTLAHIAQALDALDAVDHLELSDHAQELEELQAKLAAALWETVADSRRAPGASLHQTATEPPGEGEGAKGSLPQAHPSQADRRSRSGSQGDSGRQAEAGEGLFMGES